ncbi:ATP-binding protein [Nocardioides korecus]
MTPSAPAGGRTWTGPFSSVRLRVTAAATLAALVVALIGSALFVLLLRHSLTNELETTGTQQVETVRAQLAGGATRSEAVITGKNDVVIQLVDRSGRVVASDHPGVLTPLRTRPGTSTDVPLRPFADRFVVVAGMARSGHVLIVVGHSTEQVMKVTSSASLLLAVAVPLALAALALAVWLSVSRALRPVEEMRREAATITSAHLNRRLAVTPGDDEIPRLATTLNGMLDRIDVASTLQRQFVSDASHELRSPLAALRQLAEVARDYPENDAHRHLAQDVLAEEQRMEGLVESLLLLSRVEDSERSAARVEVDLDDVVLGEVRRQRREGGPRIDVSEVSGGQVLAEPVLVRQVVTNLLGNALRHATSEVRLALREEDEQVVLTVEDDGHGIPVQERDRIFERFVRLDESRARDAGGSGLGLAIVRKVVEDLGGSVEVGDAAAGGALFRVTLPAV